MSDLIMQTLAKPGFSTLRVLALFYVVVSRKGGFIQYIHQLTCQSNLFECLTLCVCYISMCGRIAVGILKSFKQQLNPFPVILSALISIVCFVGGFLVALIGYVAELKDTVIAKKSADDIAYL